MSTPPGQQLISVYERDMPDDSPPDLPGEAPEASRELLRRIRSGDPSGWPLAYQKYSPGMRAIARRRLIDKDSCEDAVQDAWIIFTRKVPTEPDDPTKLDPYLAQTVRNVVANYNAKATRLLQKVQTDEEAVKRFEGSFDYGPYTRLEVTERLALAYGAIDRLGEARDQDILQSLYFDLEDREDIAARHGLEADHFSKVLHRARKRLIKIIKEKLDAD